MAIGTEGQGGGGETTTKGLDKSGLGGTYTGTPPPVPGIPNPYGGNGYGIDPFGAQTPEGSFDPRFKLPWMSGSGGTVDGKPLTPEGNPEFPMPWMSGANNGWNQDTFGYGGVGGSGGTGDYPFPEPGQGPPVPTVGQLDPGTPFMQGVDMTQPGAAEKYFGDFGAGFTNRGLGQGYAENAYGKYGGGYTPGTTNRAESVFGSVANLPGPQNVQGVFNQTQGGVPADKSAAALTKFDASTPQDTSPFYANAARKGQERIDKSMASRGLYGSSAANDMIGEMNTDLAADQAKTDAQYGLSRAQLGGQLAGAADTTALGRAGLLGQLGGSADAATQARLGLLGNLGSAADTSSLAGSSNTLGWTKGLADMFGGADSARVSALLGGATVAGQAQDAQTRRGQNAFGNQMAFGNALSGTMGEGYRGMNATDEELLRDALTMYTGAGAEKFNQATSGAAQGRQDISDFFNTFGNTAKGVAGIQSMYNNGNPGGTAPTEAGAPYYVNPNGAAELAKAWGYSGPPAQP
jgi:hypothetical protein